MTEQKQALGKSGWFRILLFASLAFLAVGLARADYLKAPQIESPLRLALSLPLLMGGFVFGGVAWWRAAANGEATLASGIAGSALSVFAKYVPGKIWVVLGRSEYMANRTTLSRKELGMRSLQLQLLVLWVGLLIGAVGAVIAGQTQTLGPIAIFAWLGLSIAVFTRKPHDLAELAARRLLRREITIPHLSFSGSLRLIPWTTLSWLSWCAGFHLLVTATYVGDLPWYGGAGFAAAATFGILAVIFPGGLGVREGALTVWLVAIGCTTEQAASIALVQRLWFLLGEAAYFLLGLVCRQLEGKSK